MWKKMNIPDQVIEKNIVHYRQSEQKINATGKDFAVAWNWSAFFFNILWLAYRRCYKWAILSWLGLVVVSGILGAISGGTLAGILPLIYCVLFGMFGDSLYFYAIKEKIYKTKQKGLSDIDIINKTKPSWLPVIVVAVIEIVVCFVFATLITALFALIFSAFGGMEVSLLPSIANTIVL